MAKIAEKLEQFDWDKLDAICQYNANLIDCVELLGISADTLRRYIRERHNMTFSEYRDQKIAPTRIKLVQKALQMAKAGDRVMLIFCLKNLNKWCDKHEISSPEGNSAININITKRAPEAIELKPEPNE